MTDFSRRRFLAVSSAAAVGATWFDVAALCAADPYKGLPIGVQSYSLRAFNTLAVIRHIQGMGLHYAEFYSKHLALNATPDQIAST